MKYKKHDIFLDHGKFYVYSSGMTLCYIAESLTEAKAAIDRKLSAHGSYEYYVVAG